MFRWLLRLLLNAGALLLISYWFELIHVKDFATAVVAAFLLGVVNTFIRPVLLVLTMPLRFMTLGLIWFVINALTFAGTAYMIDGFEVGAWPSSILTTILAAAIMSVCAWIIELIVQKKDR